MSTDINIRKRIDIQEEGVSITPDVNSINFTGAGVTANAVGQDVTVDITAAAGSILYYMNQTVAQAPYQEFSSTGTTAAEQAIPATVAGGATATIAAFQTPSGVPNTIVIPQGLWQLFLHFNAATGGQSWIIRPLVYKRDLGGTETLLFSIDPITVTNMSTVTTLYSTESVVPTTILLTTDRIVVKINMENTTGTSQTVNFRTEGSQHYSVATTTLNQAVPTGAVTSVTGTAPVVSSGGTTPAISMPQANGTTDGYLDSADWTTFNNKVDDNIYTADGTVVGTRTVDLNGNTINFNDGKLGVNITPTAPLHVQTIAVPSANESIARFTVSDAAGAALTILNASSANGRFVPEISALQGLNTDNAFKLTSYIQPTQDSGSSPITVFSTALSTLAPIVTRPLYQFRNSGTSLLTILADGKVGIGTTTPTEKLEVSGKTKTTEFQMTTTPTAGYVLTSDASGNGTWSPASSGGLTYFTEAQSTAAPNATIPVDSLTAVSATTNADIAIRPKAGGALLAAIPDGTATGGNKRGQYAVDLQMSRSSQAMVASGNFSAILGGSNNTVLGANSVAAGSGNSANGGTSVAIGQNNSSTNTNSYSFGNENLSNGVGSYSIGRYNNASGTGAVAIGGNIGTYNAASGTRSVAIGEANTASGTNSAALGSLNTATDYSTALGRSNTVSSTLSSATGNGNTHAAGATYSFSVGRDNIVSAAATNSFAAGYNNTVSADRAISIGSSNASSGSGSVSIGNTLIASGNNSLALGLNSSTQSVNGKQAYASGRFLTNGDAQKGLLVLRAATPSDTPTTLTSDAGVAAATNQLFINQYGTIRFKGTIVGKTQSGGPTDVGVWDIDGVMSRGTATPQLTVGNVNLVTNPAPFGTPTLTIDTVNRTLRVQVTGLVGIPAQWVATIETTEVIYV